MAAWMQFVLGLLGILGLTLVGSMFAIVALIKERAKS